LLLFFSTAFACCGASCACAFSAPGCFQPPTAHRSIHAEILSLDTVISGFAVPSEERACAYYARGQLYLLEGDASHAVDDFSHAIGWTENFADAYAARADAYAAGGDAAHAAADYAVADASRADSPQGLSARCWVRALRGAPLERARADCDAALLALPGDVNALTARCLVFYREGRNADAVTDCTTAIQTDAKNASALFLRGLAGQRLGSASAAADRAAARASGSRVDETFAIYGIKPQ